MLKTTFGKIISGESTHHVHNPNKRGSTISWEADGSDGTLFNDFSGLIDNKVECFRVGNDLFRGPGGDNSLEVFGTHDRTDTAASHRLRFITHNRGKSYQVFTGRPDTGNAGCLRVCHLRQQIVCSDVYILTPEFSGIVDFNSCLIY